VGWAVTAAVIAVEGNVTRKAWKQHLNLVTVTLMSEALTVVVLESYIFWDITLCSSINVN
jgi:hypothetical protein